MAITGPGSIRGLLAPPTSYASLVNSGNYGAASAALSGQYTAGLDALEALKRANMMEFILGQQKNLVPLFTSEPSAKRLAHFGPMLATTVLNRNPAAQQLLTTKPQLYLDQHNIAARGAEVIKMLGAGLKDMSKAGLSPRGVNVMDPASMQFIRNVVAGVNSGSPFGSKTALKFQTVSPTGNSVVTLDKVPATDAAAKAAQAILQKIKAGQTVAPTANTVGKAPRPTPKGSTVKTDVPQTTSAPIPNFDKAAALAKQKGFQIGTTVRDGKTAVYLKKGNEVRYYTPDWQQMQ